MKKSAVLLTLVLMLAMLASMIPVQAYDSVGEIIDDYDKYGYYAYFDFENYGTSSGHLAYMRDEDATNANGLPCDPFGLMMDSRGEQKGTGETKTDKNGNTYYSYTQGGTSNYDVMAVFALQSTSGKNVIIGDAVELSFRFRLSDTQTMTGSSYYNILQLRRGSSSTITAVLRTRVDNRKLYANVNGSWTAVHTYTDELTDISVLWYDATNTYSLYINGTLVVEAVQLPANLRSSSYVSTVYNDDFGIENRTSLSASSGNSNGNDRAIEFLRSYSAENKLAYEIDDIKLSRVETAQQGAYYYRNNFEIERNGLASRYTTSDSYIFASDASASNIYRATGDNVIGNGSLYVGKGQFVGLVDDYYQQYTQGSYVIEFKVKGTPKHTSGNIPLVAVYDSHTDGTDYLNKLNMLWVASDGKLYLESDRTNAAKTLIPGITLNADNWLDVVIVATKYESNAGKFGTFKSGTTASSSDQSYTFSYYINGKYVGSAREQTLYEWKITDTENGMGITSSNDEIKVTHTEGVPDDSILGLTVVDSTTTANHIIYKSADGLTYYDVESENGSPVRYSTMTVTRPSDTTRHDTLRFFADGTFEGYIDDIKIYEGTAPESVYDAVNSGNGGVIFDLEFANFAPSTASAVYAMTKGSGNDVLGTARQGYRWDKFDHIYSNDDEVADYAHIKSDGILDLFLPVAKEVDGERNVIYSFETTIKNIAVTPKSGDVGNLYLFWQYFDLSEANGHKWIFRIDNNNKLYAGTSPGYPLYNKNGEQVVLNNDEWNTLRADVTVNKVGENSATANISYYYNGEPLYKEDGSIAHRMISSTYLTSGYNKYYANSEYGNATNFKTRFTYNVDAAATFDIKSIKINANAIPRYSDDLTTNTIENGGVTEISLTLNKNETNSPIGYYVPLSLLKKTADGESSLSLLSVDGKTGSLVIGSYNKYYSLLDKDGTVITLTNEATHIAVVYDDVADRARYYVNSEPTYIYVSGKLTPAVDLPLFSDSFATLEGVTSVSYKLFDSFGTRSENFDESVYQMNTCKVNDDDTVKVIGFQENGITDYIRIVAGVDTLYYSSAGFEIETFVDGVSMGIKQVKTGTVFSQINDDDNPLVAQDCGYNYFALLNITEVPQKMGEDTFLVIRSHANINGTKHYDPSYFIVYSDRSYSFYTDGELYENDFNGHTDVPESWPINDGAVTLSASESTHAEYFLNEEFGKHYTVSADLTMTANNGDGFMGFALKASDESNFALVGLSADGKWSIGYYENGSFTELVSTSVGKALTIGQTYRVTVVCEANYAAIFIDGIFVGEAELPEAYTEGKAGIYCSGAAVTVDNLKVTFALGKYDGNLIYRQNNEESATVNGLNEHEFLSLELMSDVKNFVYSANLTTTEIIGESSSMGLVFGVQEDGTFAKAALSIPDGKWVIEYYDGTEYTNTESGVITGGTALNNTYNVKVSHVNGTVKLYIDNTLYCEYTLPDVYKAGGFGAYADGVKAELRDTEVFKKAGVKITAATYNVGDWSSTSVEAGSEEARQLFLEAFLKTEADIWGLQEDTEYFSGTTSGYDAVYKDVHPYYVSNYTKEYNRKSFVSGYEITAAEAVYYKALNDYAYPSYDHAWFYVGKVKVDGNDVTVISLHFDWSDKNRRAEQIQNVIDFAKEQEYCIIMGDFNPENCVNREKLSSELLYEEELARFEAAGFEPANAGRFGTFDTLANRNYTKRVPFDNVLVSSNITILDAYTVCEPWMSDHAIMVADIEIN